MAWNLWRVHIKMKLYITRHGTTEWNTKKRLQGWKDSPLTQDGKNRAIKLGQSFSSIDFDIIYSSPQKRALETSRLIRGAKNTELKVHDGLKELGYGVWDGMLVSDIEKKYGEEYSLFLSAPDKYIPIDGESMTDLFNRAQAFLDELKSKDYNKVLIVSHGITIKALIAILKELSWDEFSGLEVYTGTALNVCKLNGNKFEFLLEGDTSHL